jgi:hypothetical protein
MKWRNDIRKFKKIKLRFAKMYFLFSDVTLQHFDTLTLCHLTVSYDTLSPYRLL